MGSSSPWGTVQHSITIKKGIRIVDTAGHGGIMVAKGYASKHFTEAAIKKALVYGNYLCYEEDCDWAIAMHELWDILEEYWGEKAEKNKQEIMSTLSRYNPDYLLAVGKQPLEKEYSRYKMDRLVDEMRINKDPDLIVCARGDWHTKIPGVCEVITADNKTHYVKTESYDSSRYPNLLSACEIVNN